MENLLMKVNNIEDTRQTWKLKHNLVDILIIVMLSILTGPNAFDGKTICGSNNIYNQALHN